MLKDIFNSITPENIKNIPLMKDAMEIFIETLEEKCEVSQEIKAIFKQENEVARNEFIKIYLDDLNRYLTKAKTDPAISNRIDKMNELYGADVVERDFIGDLVDLFNDEHFVTSKAFKQKKGTKVGIEYIYNLVEGMIDEAANDSSFVFIPGDPFEFTIEGSIYREIYDGIVKPLAHPLGFTYVYLQVIRLALQDYYQIEYGYTNVDVEVRCLVDDTTVVDVYPGEDVVDIQESVDASGDRITKVLFVDGTYLLQLTNPIHVAYFAADNTVIKDYTGHCSLYLQYELVVNILTSDYMDTREHKFMDDDYWLDTSNPGYIGGIVIGEFYIGGFQRYVMNETLTIISSDDVSGEDTTYGVPVDYLGFNVGATTIGYNDDNVFVGFGLEEVTAPTSEVYDPRVELDEEFTIETI